MILGANNATVAIESIFTIVAIGVIVAIETHCHHWRRCRQWSPLVTSPFVGHFNVHIAIAHRQWSHLNGAIDHQW